MQFLLKWLFPASKIESPKVKMAGTEGEDLARATGEATRSRAKCKMSKSIEEEDM